MDENLKKQLKIFACKARIGAIDGIYCAKAGHPGGSLSICDLLSYLYNVEMNVDPKNPKTPKETDLSCQRVMQLRLFMLLLHLKVIFR